MKLNTLSLILIPPLTYFLLSPISQAVSPPPDGGYPNFTTAEGQNALQSLTTGPGNTALGWRSLFSDSTGSFNTGVGAGALVLNTGDENTATGVAALLSNLTGTHNTANGVLSLFLNSIGTDNTASGFDALFSNTAGNFNTANGSGALDFTTTGNSNTAIGASALQANTTGNNNTAVGELALGGSQTGSSNVAVGFNAAPNVMTASNVICIGANLNAADVSNTAWIANVFGVTTQNGNALPVVVSVDGQLGTVASSARFKKDIVTMEKASEAIMSLRPVTFHYKTDTQGVPQFGLIAEEVAKVNPSLVLPDKEGKPYTVRYDAVNAMLLNEFLKEHRTVQGQQKEIDALKAELKEQKALIRKVSAQLEASKPASQVVNNP